MYKLDTIKHCTFTHCTNYQSYNCPGADRLQDQKGGLPVIQLLLLRFLCDPGLYLM